MVVEERQETGVGHMKTGGACGEILKSAWFRWELLPIAALMMFGLHFWRTIIFNDDMLGNLGDGRFTALVSEHWWQFFIGNEKFGSIPIFFGNSTALGYSDLHLAHGIIHSAFRAFGFSIYPAFKIACLGLHLLGLVSMYYLLRKTLHMSVLSSMIGDVAFSFCCAMTISSVHPQLMAMGMLPALLISIVNFMRNVDSRKKRNIHAYFTILWFILLVYTSWYTAFFTGMFCLVFAIVFAAQLSRVHAGSRSRLYCFLRKLGWDPVFYAIFASVLFIPFVAIYFPVMREGNMYEYSGSFLPDPIDLINVTEDNVMLGWLMKLINVSGRGRNSELWVGFSVVLLGLFVFACATLFKKGRKGRRKDSLEDALLKSVCFSVIACILLVIRWDGSKLSLWAIVYALLPPARAIRAVSRFLLWLCFPMSIFAAYQADREAVFKKTRAGKIGGCALLGLMYFSSIFHHPMRTDFHYGERKAFMRDIPKAPDDMESFYVTDSEHGDRKWYKYNLDAWEIALATGKPTLNGYSGHFPEGWELGDPNSASYKHAVRKWVVKHGLENVFSYDLATKSWTMMTSTSACDCKLNVPILFSTDSPAGHDYVLSGLYDAEPWGAWSAGNQVLFALNVNASAPILHADFDTMVFNGVQPVTISVNDEIVYDNPEYTGTEHIRFDFRNPGIGKPIFIKFTLPGAVSSLKFGESGDRILALGFFQMRIEESAIPLYRLGSKIDFTSVTNNATNHIVRGMYFAEDWGTWTSGHTAELLIRCEKTSDRLRARLECDVFAGRQRVKIYVNGKQSFSKTVVAGEDVEFDFEPSEVLRIRFELPDASSPSKRLKTQDARIIALGMKSLTIREADARFWREPSTASSSTDCSDRRLNGIR